MLGPWIKANWIKQEMATGNVDVLGISKLKWTEMGEFSSDDHYSYYCGQESLKRNGVAIMVNKRIRNAVFGRSLKNNRMISVRFQGKPFSITVIQVYALTSNSPGKNTGVHCHFFLQEIFPTQGLNPGLPYCRQTLYHLSNMGSSKATSTSFNPESNQRPKDDHMCRI